MIRRFASFRRDRRGIAAVEFAILAPVMILLIAGSIEAGHLFMVRNTLEGAVSQAAREAMANLELEEDVRDEMLRTRIGEIMGAYRTADGRELTIDTIVYRDFSSAYPEAFEDVNGNGVYDEGEPFEDRNRNGRHDPATPVPGKLGGPGDVVAYTAVFPARLYFDFLGDIFVRDGLPLTASTVMRNEPVAARRAAWS